MKKELVLKRMNEWPERPREKKISIPEFKGGESIRQNGTINVSNVAEKFKNIMPEMSVGFTSPAELVDSRHNGTVGSGVPGK